MEAKRKGQVSCCTSTLSLCVAHKVTLLPTMRSRQGNSSPKSSLNPVSDQLNQLLQSFKDVFIEPRGPTCVQFY